jgi:N-acyl-D-aspartate/D-glutamate deacylase
VAYDLVIRNGVVIDGSGMAPVRADVGVEGGRITKVGRIRDAGAGAEVIDAEGHVVTPGFVDGHTHMDAQVFWDHMGTNSCWHGVSTVVMGNCGFTLAPARNDERPLVVRSLERAEDISPAAMAQGIEWTWQTFSEYLDAIDRVPKALNYAAQVGHSALRTWAMGERAFDSEATDDDLATMETELRDALRAGAIGFTTSRTPLHQTADGRPVASRLASWGEVRRLVNLMGAEGNGVFEITNEPAAGSDDPDERNEYFDRMRNLALESGSPITFGVGASASGMRTLGLIESTVAAGGRMFGMSHSRGISGMLSFRTQLPFDRLPEWKAIRSLPIEEQRARFLDPVVREQLVKAAHHGDYGPAVGAEARRPDYTMIQVWQHPIPPNPTIAELADQRNVDPVELMIDLALETDFEQFFFQPMHRYGYEDLVRVMKHPRTVMTFSDSGAHVSQIADASIQTHLLAYWVRQEQRFTLEEAVRMLTYVPATFWGFPDRGLVREGMVADLNVLDPVTVGPRMPEVVFDLPGGAKRLIQKADGFLTTIVGGQPITRNGEATEARPGRLLRSR